MSTTTREQHDDKRPMSEQLLYECPANTHLQFQPYTSELQLSHIKRLMDIDLSEPYSVYTYRYFLNNWPDLCILMVDTSVSCDDNGDEKTLKTVVEPQNEEQQDPDPAAPKHKIMGAIVCKCDEHSSVNYGTVTMRGYIAMLAVDATYRKRGIGRALVARAIEAMRDCGANEVVLETECVNKAALGLYESLGFIREKRLHKYYLNQGSAYRLKLSL